MDRSHLHTGAVVLLLAAVALATPFAGVAAADSGGTIKATPDGANATATHNATVTVGEQSAGNLTAIALNYSDTNTSLDLVTDNVVVGIDRGNNSSGMKFDQDVTVNLTGASFGADPGQVTLQFDGSVDVQPGDQVVLSLQEVKNPPEGEYTILLDVNPEQGGEPARANLSIGPAQNTETGTATATATDSPGGGGDGGDGGGGDGGSDGGGPGFGLAAALAAVAAAALLALRRSS